MAESEILWVIGYETPTHPYLAEIIEETISEPYPALLWRVNDNKIYHEILQEIPETMSFPFPSLAWKIENGRFTQGLLPDEIPKAMEKPYPKAMWRLEKDSFTHRLLPDYLYLGAFENTKKLIKVIIPESVKKIGRLGFSRTQLNTVKIASDCEYSESSFPEGCGIEFYSD